MQNKNAFASRKSEDTKVETKKKIVVQEETRSLFLQNNRIPSICDLASILEDVMWNSNRLLWMDLSNNHLKEIDEDLGAHFPELKTLYLHGNYIQDMSQITRFAKLEDLQTITLYGNPIEHIKNYRLIALNVLYQSLTNLRKFD